VSVKLFSSCVTSTAHEYREHLHAQSLRHRCGWKMTLFKKPVFPPAVTWMTPSPGTLPVDGCGSPLRGFGPRSETKIRLPEGDRSARSRASPSGAPFFRSTVLICAPVPVSKTSAKFSTRSSTQTKRSCFIATAPCESRSRPRSSLENTSDPTGRGSSGAGRTALRKGPFGSSLWGGRLTLSDGALRVGAMTRLFRRSRGLSRLPRSVTPIF
jgi:hypothetical protein